MRDDETVYLRPDPAERELMRGDWIRSGWPDNAPTFSDVDGLPVHVTDVDRLASTWVRDPFEGQASATLRDTGYAGRIRRVDADDPRHRPLQVTLDDIEAQREAGWPDWHPEDYCHRCGGGNTCWHTVGDQRAALRERGQS